MGSDRPKNTNGPSDTNRSIFAPNPYTGHGIDPFSDELSAEDKKLLYLLFKEEEKKDKRRTELKIGEELKTDKVKIKIWEASKCHEINGKKFHLKTQINRRKKTYSSIVILGPGEEIPDPEEKPHAQKVFRGILYLKKLPDGGVAMWPDGKTIPKLLTRQEWDQEIKNKCRHLEAKIAALDSENLSIGTVLQEDRDKKELITSKTYKLGEQQRILRSLLDNNQHKEIRDDTKNHAMFSAILATYGNEYIYEDFPILGKNAGEGAAKVAKVSRGKFKLVEPDDANPNGSILVRKNLKHKKIAFEVSTKKPQKPGKRGKSGDELKEMVEDEIEVLLEHPTLATKFNPKKRTIQRNEKGKIVAVYFTENQAPGVDLDTIRDKLNVDQLKEITALLLEAVNADQQNGITHKDIKEKNVIVDIDPTSEKVKSVTIVDYGSAGKKQKKLVVGTPGYTSPEMYLHPSNVDARTDHYSLGVLLGRLWKNAVILERARHLQNQPGRDIDHASIAEYHLHISTPKAKLSKKILDNLDSQYAENLQRVLNGLTMPHPDYRMSPGEALTVIGIKEKPNAEMKAAEVKNDEEIDVIKAFESLGRIQSDYPLLYLLKEALEQLQDYAKTLPENHKTRQFLFDCYKEITSSQYKLPHSTFPAVIIFVSETCSRSPDTIIPEKELSKLKGMLYNLEYYKKQIWDDTFLAGMSRNEKKTVSILYVIGWRRRSEEIAGIIAAGFILTPIKNIFKLFTEFPLKIIAETVNYLRKNVERRQPSDLLGKAARAFFLYVILYPLTIATTGAWLLMRTITSPKTSMREAIKANDSFRKKLDAFHPESFLGKTGKYIGLAACKLRLLPIFSGLCTLAGFAALAILATPAIAYVSTQMGITGAITAPGAWPVFSTMASWMVTPAMWLAGQLGITASAALLAGASVVSLLTVYALGLRAAVVEIGQRYWMTRNVAVAPGPVTTQTSPAANIEKPQMTTSKLLTKPGMAPENKKTLSWKHERNSSDTGFTAVSSTSHSAASETKTLAPAGSEEPGLGLTSKSPSPR